MSNINTLKTQIVVLRAVEAAGRGVTAALNLAIDKLDAVLTRTWNRVDGVADKLEAKLSAAAEVQTDQAFEEHDAVLEALNATRLAAGRQLGKKLAAADKLVREAEAIRLSRLVEED